VESGTRAPGFALPDAKLQVYDLYDYRGKMVLLELMSTTCQHCNAFANVLEKVQSQFAGRVQILAVANSRQDNQDSVAQYVAAHKINYPVLFDAGQMAFSYVRKSPFDLPQVFLIDGNGIVQRHYEYGPFSKEIFEGNALVTEIDKLLGPAKKK
jgi:peroxiredoxin